ESDNHYAEQLMRKLGTRDGDTGNDANGIAAERAILKAQAIPTPGLTLVDGSGLAHANRVSARTLAAILERFDTQPGGNVLYPLLARGGKDGTLKRYHFDAAAGRVRAKTGHLSDTAALAGYVDTVRHGRVAFAFLIDGSPGDPDDAIINAIDKIAQH
ncbi:MAG TPA: D-alanyl-D-alanine carboxypeptidase, partial [Candidatus Baltobacteraceae bacterium]|nr:D-alanyl-D-alanine carboxypeptidase [Candidatus Baltobacteraceae bacterium]